MTPAAVTMKDIARRTGVSYTTVSNVLTERWKEDSRIKVHPATLAKVQKAANEMGWVPNHLARNLVSRHSRIIGALWGDFDFGFPVEVARHAQARLETQGYHLLPMFTHFEQDRLLKAVSDLVSFKVAGVLCLLHMGVDFVESELKRRNLPRVFIDHYDPVARHTVGSDDMTGMAKIVDHLVERGEKRLAYVAPAPLPGGFRTRTQVLREAAFHHALGARHLKGEVLVGGALDDKESSLRLAQWLHRESGVLVCFNDVLAASAILGLRQLGLEAPKDYRVTGYCDMPEMRYLTPGLTTVRQNVVRMGCEAADLLLAQLEGRAPEAKETLTPVSLVVRESA